MMKPLFSRWNEIIRIAWPLIIANSFWNLQVTIDRIFLGQYSTDALGASMAASGLFWAPMALVQQTAAYVSVFAAQYYGSKQFKKIGPSFWQSVYAATLGGLLFLILIPLTPMIVRFMGHSENIQLLEIQYFQTLCLSALPTALLASCSGFFTGLSRTSVIIYLNLIGLVFNVVLDYIMIFGHFGFPAMGIAGAGLATALATWAAALFGFYLVLKKENETLYGIKTLWKLDLELMGRFIKFGVPSGLQWALEGLAFTVFLIIIGQMPNGDAALSASGITVTIMMLGILPVLGVAQAVSVLVGQHLGENKPDLARSSTWSGAQVSAIYIGLTGLSFILFPSFYLSWFENSENPLLWKEVQEITKVLLIFVAAFCTFDSMNLVFSFALKGAGDTRFVSIIALLLPWPLMSFPTWLTKDWNHAAYWAWGWASVYIIIQGCIFFMRFRQGKWQKMRVI